MLIGLLAAAEDDVAARAGHHGEEEEHDHDDFDQLVVTPEASADLDAVRAAVGRALEQPGVLRVKGYASVAGKPAPLVVQAVGGRIDLAYVRPGSAARPGLKGIDHARIEQALGAA